MALDKAGLNPLLSWMWQLLSMFSGEEIKVPSDFHDSVFGVNEVLLSDTSGIVNTMLDFSINAALVDYSIETDRKSFTTLLNEWLGDINSDLIGRVPTGITALAREYFRERWKRSSLIVLRTEWNVVDGINLPTKMWFVNGANVYVEDKNKDVRTIGKEKYFLKVGNKEADKKPIPSSKNELIFVQKPFDSWDRLYSTPYVIQRGLYKNLSLLNLMNSKGEKIIGKAIEYLFATKKGTEGMALSGNPNFIYSEGDLTALKDSFSTFRENSKSTAGTPAYFTNFDTEMEHLIPDYSKALNQALYAPLERRLLAGLGLIEIVEGISSTRKEGILNPKPFVAEIKSGVDDFMILLTDLVKTIRIQNKGNRRCSAKKIEVTSSPIDDFLDDSIKTHLRSMYDRGVLSKQTYLEVVGGEFASFKTEVARREKEEKDGVDEIMSPQPIQYIEEVEEVDDTEKLDIDKIDNEVPEDRNTTEKVNFNGNKTKNLSSKEKKKKNKKD